MPSGKGEDIFHKQPYLRELSLLIVPEADWRELSIAATSGGTYPPQDDWVLCNRTKQEFVPADIKAVVRKHDGDQWEDELHNFHGPRSRGPYLLHDDLEVEAFCSGLERLKFQMKMEESKREEQAWSDDALPAQEVQQEDAADVEATAYEGEAGFRIR
ncbi:hypothetical protein GY45DRAFT_1373546 [Cubamyces sp. BRFM 1775]|nr:hypothetical protein GY45DRAFT_1373546 [Cubamyces sp. BRFM 1775]